jgi:RNase adaptor protein for sRNA GlmZ degradation
MKAILLINLYMTLPIVFLAATATFVVRGYKSGRRWHSRTKTSHRAN